VHPVLACADAIDVALKDVAGVDPTFMRVGEKAEALRRLDGLESRLAGLRMRVMAGAEDVAETTADHSAATWLAVESRTDPRERVRELALARSLERRWTRLAAAVTDGSVNLAQASVIVHALEDLPEKEVGAEAVAKAEEALIGYAQQYAPRHLRRLGRRILEVAAPDLCDEAEGRALEREERRAASVTSLSLRRLGDGTTRISGRLAEEVADRLRTYLDAYTSPRHRGIGEGDPVPPRRRLGQAFGAFLESVDPDRMPLHGGDATTVLVTIDLETLRSRLAGVGMVGEEPISAGQARRLAAPRPSSRSSSAAPRCRWTSGGPIDCSRRTSARRWRCATGAVGPRGARSRRRGARPTTPPTPGSGAAGRTWPTASCSVRGTTTVHTTRGTTRAGWATATTGSTGGPRPATDRQPTQRGPAGALCQFEVRSTPQDFFASAAILSAASLTSLLFMAWICGMMAWSFAGSTPGGSLPLCICARSLGLMPAALRASSRVVIALSRVFQSAETLLGALSARVWTFSKTVSSLPMSALDPLSASKYVLSAFSSSQ
jgi:hypothetical protein